MTNKYETYWNYLKSKHGNKFVDQGITLESLMDEVETKLFKEVANIGDTFQSSDGATWIRTIAGWENQDVFYPGDHCCGQ